MKIFDSEEELREALAAFEVSLALINSAMREIDPDDDESINSIMHHTYTKLKERLLRISQRRARMAAHGDLWSREERINEIGAINGDLMMAATCAIICSQTFSKFYAATALKEISEEVLRMEHARKVGTPK